MRCFRQIKVNTGIRGSCPNSSSTRPHVRHMDSYAGWANSWADDGVSNVSEAEWGPGQLGRAMGGDDPRPKRAMTLFSLADGLREYIIPLLFLHAVDCLCYLRHRLILLGVLYREDRGNLSPIHPVMTSAVTRAQDKSTPNFLSSCTTTSTHRLFGLKHEAHRIDTTSCIQEKPIAISNPF